MKRERRTSQETGSGRGMESGNSRFLFPAISSAKKKNGKLRPVIDLSLLNQYINKQHFKMEMVKSVRLSIMANDWAVSTDLTDAYLCVHNTSEIQKIPLVRLTVRNVPKCVDFHKINECNSSTLTTRCRSGMKATAEPSRKSRA